MKLLRSALGALSLALLTTLAGASESLVIKSDQTQLLSVSGTPGAVVVGNPSIADATVHDDKIFLHGRAHGSTNLIILDQEGNQMAAFDITVQVGGTNNVAVFKAATRYSYTCAPLCEAAMQVGDDVPWTDDIIKLNGKKLDLATGKNSAESAPPPVAQ
jgi:Pilus formation protein N terminal region